MKIEGKPLQLYGKSIAYSSALAMFVVALGNADDDDQNVMWLAAPKPDGTGIGQLAALHLVESAEPSPDEALTPESQVKDSAQALSSEAQPQSDSSGAGAVARQQDADIHSDTSADDSQFSADQGDQDDDVDDDEDDDIDDEDEEDEEEEDDSESGSDAQTNGAALPSMDRIHAVALLPVSRQEMQTPGLVLGVPSHGASGMLAYVFEPAHSSGRGCAVVAQLQDVQVSLPVLALPRYACLNIASD